MNGITPETIEKHMYTYLQRKYGLKSQVIEQAGSILQGVRQFEKCNIEIYIFSKLLKNELEEDFITVVEQVGSTMTALLKSQIQSK
jgi:hypothetical protein